MLRLIATPFPRKDIGTDDVNQKEILLLDTGREWGGGTNMLELLKRIDRQRFAITCCFIRIMRVAIRRRLPRYDAIGIPVTFIAQRRQPLWAKSPKSCCAPCCFNRAVKKRHRPHRSPVAHAA